MLGLLVPRCYQILPFCPSLDLLCHCLGIHLPRPSSQKHGYRLYHSTAPWRVVSSLVYTMLQYGHWTNSSGIVKKSSIFANQSDWPIIISYIAYWTERLYNIAGPSHLMAGALKWARRNALMPRATDPRLPWIEGSMVPIYVAWFKCAENRIWIAMGLCWRRTFCFSVLCSCSIILACLIWFPTQQKSCKTHRNHKHSTFSNYGFVSSHFSTNV